MKKNIIKSMAVVLVALVFFTGCSFEFMSSESNNSSKMASTYELFTGTKSKTIKAEKGKTIDFDYSSEVEKGELTIEVFDPDEESVLKFETNKSGSKELKAQKDGEYEVVITGSKTEGNYSVKWSIK